jgi:hypothetical protein
MATYFLRVSTFSRAKGARITRLAAYRAGERIRDERTGETYNSSDRQDVVHKEIVLPSHLAESADMEWARNRSALWNAAEHAGRQRNARLAREVLVILPHELTPAQRISLVRFFSRELADKYQNVVDFSIHPPRPGSDERNHHAHILMTTREITAHGLGVRTALELSGTERHARGLGPSKTDYFLMRERWAQLTNEALREAGVQARIDHRSLKEQGIDREPRSDIPRKVHYAEQKSGRSTPAGDEIRARHRERVDARLKGGDELARVLQRQKEENRQRAIEWYKQTEGRSKKTPRSALTKEELRQRERERRKENREALNQKRRERYKGNAEAVLQKQRAWRQANAQRISDQRRQWYKANAEKVKQQARERWSKVREQRQVAAKSAQESARTEQSAFTLGQRAPPDTAKEAVKNWLAFRESHKEAPTAEDSVKNWLAFRESHKETPTAEDSVKNWLAFRESHKETPTAEDSVKNWLAFRESQKKVPTAEDSAKNWLAFRQSQKQADPSQTASHERSREQGLGVNADKDDEDNKSKKTGHSRDNDYGL